MPRPQPTPSVHREILALAIPALATLVSEPLLVIADSAIIGHLSTETLAGLGIAGNVIGVVTGLCVFLAYGTTATVARYLGAGRRRDALTSGFDGMMLALVVGAVLALLAVFLAPTVIGWYAPPDAVAGPATLYLRVVGLAFPALLVMLASTGILRGLQDTRTPLYVAVGLNLTNIALNFLLVYGAKLGILGAALGTLTSQYAASAILAMVVLRGARREGASLRFHVGRILTAAKSGFWLLLRTVSLQTSITANTIVATHLGAAGLAAHQVTNSLWTFLAFALDALAIACQAIIGRHLGAGDAAAARAVTRTAVGWGIGAGIILGALTIASRPWLMRLFTPDPEVWAPLFWSLLVIGVFQPVAGVVFVLDGVLIGAGDARYLALAGLVASAIHLPLIIWVGLHGPALWMIWAVHGGYLLLRMATQLWRVRTDAWMRLGA